MSYLWMESSLRNWWVFMKRVMRVKQAFTKIVMFGAQFSLLIPREPSVKIDRHSQ